MTGFTDTLLLAGAVVGAVAASAAFASPVSVSSLVVRYEPAALTTDRGVRALYFQISQAAGKVCPSSYSLLANELVTRCREQAITGAVDKIHNQRLTAVHAAASSKSG